MLQLNPTPDVRVNVVGDTHGQLHDALKLLDLAGFPSETNWFVFNGDFVDRGAWGAELLAVAMAWKVARRTTSSCSAGTTSASFARRCTDTSANSR